jgi:hypothetical protein
MPFLEMHEIQETQVWTRVEITEEQAKEYKEWQKNGAKNNEWEPEWVDSIDWGEGDVEQYRPGSDSVVSVEVIDAS